MLPHGEDAIRLERLIEWDWPDAPGRNPILSGDIPPRPEPLPDEHAPIERRTVHRIVATTARKAGIGHVRPHQLRHTLATQAINACGPVGSATKSSTLRHLGVRRWPPGRKTGFVRSGP